MANSTADEMSAGVSGSICTERTMPSVGCGGGRRASCPSTLLISLVSHSAQCMAGIRKADGRRHAYGAAKVGISQPSHVLDGRYGTAASMPGTLQDADLQIRIPAHWPDAGH
jgi:hypothetical protein